MKTIQSPSFSFQTSSFSIIRILRHNTHKGQLKPALYFIIYKSAETIYKETGGQVLYKGELPYATPDDPSEENSMNRSQSILDGETELSTSSSTSKGLPLVPGTPFNSSTDDTPLRPTSGGMLGPRQACQKAHGRDHRRKTHYHQIRNQSKMEGNYLTNLQPKNPLSRDPRRPSKCY